MRLPCPAALAALLLAACGSSSPSDPAAAADAGYAALNAGRAQAAVDHFEGAYAALAEQAESPALQRVVLGLIEAEAARDPGGAANVLESLHVRHPRLLEPGDYLRLADSLMASGATKAAVRALELGQQRFPDDPSLAALEARLVARAKRGEDADLTAELQGIGYLGE